MSQVPKEIKELEKIEVGSNEVLYKASSFFPMQIFPDSITVDKNKIDIVHRTFLWTKTVFSILIEDLTTVNVSLGPLFASIMFEVRGYERNPEPIRHLLIKDALKLHEIILGLTKAKREAIDINNVEKDEALDKLRNIGQIKEDLKAAV